MKILSYYLFHDAKMHVVSHWAESPKGVVCPPNILQVAESFSKIVQEVYEKAPVKFEVLKTPQRVVTNLQGLLCLEFHREGDQLTLVLRTRNSSTQTREWFLVSQVFNDLIAKTAAYLRRGSEQDSLKDKVTKGLV